MFDYVCWHVSLHALSAANDGVDIYYVIYQLKYSCGFVAPVIEHYTHQRIVNEAFSTKNVWSFLVVSIKYAHTSIKDWKTGGKVELSGFGRI